MVFIITIDYNTRTRSAARQRPLEIYLLSLGGRWARTKRKIPEKLQKEISLAESRQRREKWVELGIESPNCYAENLYLLKKYGIVVRNSLLFYYFSEGDLKEFTK